MSSQWRGRDGQFKPGHAPEVGVCRTCGCMFAPELQATAARPDPFAVAEARERCALCRATERVVMAAIAAHPVAHQRTSLENVRDVLQALAPEWMRTRDQVLDLEARVSALESREVCTVAHEGDVATCGYCQRDRLAEHARILEGGIRALLAVTEHGSNSGRTFQARVTAYNALRATGLMRPG